MAVNILSCGQCSFDHRGICSLFKELNENIVVSEAHSIEEALLAIDKQRFSLILVNRIFDRSGEEGLDLIDLVRKMPQPTKPPLLLVSNLPAAQKLALERGALVGFGKAQLTSPETKLLIKKHLNL